MQIITAFLKVAGSKGIWSTLYDRKTASPEIVVGVAAKLRFDLRQDQKDEELILMPYPAEELNCSSYYLALDVDFLHTTTPRLLISSDITLHSGPAGETFLPAPPPLHLPVGVSTQTPLTGLACVKQSLGPFPGLLE